MSSNLDLLEEATAKLLHSTRAMFGGHGLFAPNGGMFAGIVDDDRVILKLADAKARAQLEKEGGRAWVYKGKMGETTMAEWILIPQAFYDEPYRLEQWAMRAHALAPAKKAKPLKAGAQKQGATRAGKKSAVKGAGGKKAAAKKGAAKKAPAKSARRKAAAKKPAKPKGR